MAQRHDIFIIAMLDCYVCLIFNVQADKYRQRHLRIPIVRSYCSGPDPSGKPSTPRCHLHLFYPLPRPMSRASPGPLRLWTRHDTCCRCGGCPRGGRPRDGRRSRRCGCAYAARRRTYPTVIAKDKNILQGEIWIVDVMLC